MLMQIDGKIEKIKLPKIYRKENKNCYFDPYRKRLIEITPEETVRQKIAKYFEIVLKVPMEFIHLEVPMSYYNPSYQGRADIIIHEPLLGELKKPIAIIECKKSTVSLTTNVEEQAYRYCEKVDAKFIILTNGSEIKIARYNKKSKEYEWLEKLLTFDQMVNLEGKVIESLPPYERMSYKQLNNNNTLQKFNDNNSHEVFGIDTPIDLRSNIVNFYECLMDTTHKLKAIKRKNFEIIEDVGIRYMDYSNAGGGHYLGNYRAFIVKDAKGDTQILSLSLFGVEANFRGENNFGYTSLIVSIDKYKTSHNSLQYNVDKYAIHSANSLRFIHNGQISSRPAKPLLEYVLSKSENIKHNAEDIDLGQIKINGLLYLDNSEVAEVVYNFIEYGILREEYRENNKIKRTNSKTRY